MGFILVVHILACVLLVITVLMQAGRGGGLTETFQSAESMFGTQTNAFMVRLTTGLAAVFLCTSLILAFNASKGEKSLMANRRLLATVPKPAPESKQAEPDVQVNVSSPKPLSPETALPGHNAPAAPVTNAQK